MRYELGFFAGKDPFHFKSQFTSRVFHIRKLYLGQIIGHGSN